MSVLDKIEDVLGNFLRGLSIRSDKKRAEVLDNENLSEKYLDLPLIGGPLYILSRYSYATKFNQQIKRDLMRTDIIRDNIKEEHSIKNSIRRQLEEFQMEGGTVEISIKPSHSVYFKETLLEFPGIVCADLGGGDFVMSSNDDI